MGHTYLMLAAVWALLGCCIVVALAARRRSRHIDRLMAEYDTQQDFSRSITEGFKIIRERKASGGPGWQRTR